MFRDLWHCCLLISNPVYLMVDSAYSGCCFGGSPVVTGIASISTLKEGKIPNIPLKLHKFPHLPGHFSYFRIYPDPHKFPALKEHHFYPFFFSPTSHHHVPVVLYPYTVFPHYFQVVRLSMRRSFEHKSP